MASSDATLPLPDICVRALEGRLELERRLRSQAEAWHESGLVITTKLGEPVDPRIFYRAFQARCRRAGVPTTTVHATRKACPSLLVALDVHPRVAMQILRHSQIAVTMDVYSQVTSDSTLQALKALGERSKATERHDPPAPLLHFAAVLGSFAVSSGGESGAD